jgi:hypothetical protein
MISKNWKVCIIDLNQIYMYNLYQGKNLKCPKYIETYFKKLDGKFQDFEDYSTWI